MSSNISYRTSDSPEGSTVLSVDRRDYAAMEQIVEDAAILLDQIKPGWHHSVRLGQIVMSSCTRCILGWVYGAEAARVGGCDGYTYGFRLLTFHYEQFEEELVNTATWRKVKRAFSGYAPVDLWIREIELRRMVEEPLEVDAEVALSY